MIGQKYWRGWTYKVSDVILIANLLLVNFYFGLR